MPEIVATPTPNPNALKFAVVGATVIPSGLLSFRSAGEAAAHPLGAALFALDGVADVLLVPPFATVTKHPAADWNLLLPAVERVLTQHLASAP